ncbi:MAG: hypothetical protein RMJ43_16090 [Chloroherpetonaceae bacterium]|nr:hypothetical protein [Chthonomonadaceae bacterium]MDW8209354.1 hypothetical protein [Chloroherpetonaceae bacterium]
MSVRWWFYRFDHARYVLLRPALRSATSPAALAAIADSPEVCALAEALQEQRLSLLQARRAFVRMTCCVGDPVPVDAHFARVVSAMGRRRGAEDAAELLAELLAGQKNREPWLGTGPGLQGFLTAEETVRLARSYPGMPRALRSRGRRFWLWRWAEALRDLARRLFRRRLPDAEAVRRLGVLIAEAATRGEGIAVVSD